MAVLILLFLLLICLYIYKGRIVWYFFYFRGLGSDIHNLATWKLRVKRHMWRRFRLNLAMKRIRIVKILACLRALFPEEVLLSDTSIWMCGRLVSRNYCFSSSCNRHHLIFTVNISILWEYTLILDLGKLLHSTHFCLRLNLSSIYFSIQCFWTGKRFLDFKNNFYRLLAPSILTSQ
jgi:hypothetical protein